MKTIFALLMAVCVSVAAARPAMEVLPLENRSAEEVLPALQELLEPGATLTGSGNQLFLRASPRNRDEIKRALKALDTATRRLAIYVSQDRDGRGNDSGAGQAWGTRSARAERGNQMVQTVDGGQAFIQVGRSLPVPLRQIVVGPGGAVASETTVYRDLGQGFYAQPKVKGQRVTVEITQQAESANPRYGHGGSDYQRLSTTVSGKLGEWMQLGGTGASAAPASDRRGNGFSVSTAEVKDNRSLWLKVEELD